MYIIKITIMLLTPETQEVTCNNWYGPLKFLKEHKNVVGAWLTDITRSAGSWSGLVAIRQSATDGDVDIYEFSQENVNPFGEPSYELNFRFVDSTLLPVTEDKALAYAA